jgi:hypothetical protein
MKPQPKTSELFSSIHNANHETFGTNLRGEVGELIAQLFFVSHGWRISKAGGDWYPYDLSIERHGKTLRVQVKTAAGQNSAYYRTRFGMSDEFDVACIVTEAGDVYVIPRSNMKFEAAEPPRHGHRENRRFILYPRLDQFKVAKFSSFGADGLIERVDELDRMLLA